MTVRSSAGSTLQISATKPATFDAAGYEALMFTEIGQVTDLGEFGRESTVITFNPLGSRGTQKLKGSFNEGTITVSAGLSNADAGQILAKAASKSDEDYSFVINTQAGDEYFFQAKVMSFKVSIGSVESITSVSITLEITTSNTGVGVVEVLAV